MDSNKASKEERIRHQAYLIWLEEGRPEVRENEHWEKAERIVNRLDELCKEDESGNDAAIGPVPGP
jgi:hypothetical protein